MRGSLPRMNGAGFEGSAPIDTTTGTEVPGGPAICGTRTLIVVLVTSTTGTSTLPNRTDAPWPQPLPARTTSSPVIAKLGERPWLRGAW